MTIIKFPAYQCNCASCQIPFKPRRMTHVFCDQCYRLGRAGAHLAAAAAPYAEQRHEVAP